MDDDELMVEWSEFVIQFGTAEAGALAVQADVQWDELDADELDELLVGFADDHGVEAATRVATMISMGSE